MGLQRLKDRLKSLANKEQAEFAQRFFKTGSGEYGEGDIFLGIRVPVLRKLAKEFNLPIRDVQTLLESPFHEERFVALIILILHYQKGDETVKKSIYELYLANTKHINNWDLVDVSAMHIVGDYLFERDKSPLYRLVKSEDLWERRIAIIATFCFIKRRKFEDTLKLSKELLQDKEDLIHKAVGWMLRETGKRELAVEEEFLKHHYQTMPRTMLRYAIEKFPEPKRQAYLKGKI